MHSQPLSGQVEFQCKDSEIEKDKLDLALYSAICTKFFGELKVETQKYEEENENFYDFYAASFSADIVENQDGQSRDENN